MNAREVMEALLRGERVGEVGESSYVELTEPGHLTRSPGMTQDEIAHIFTHSSCCEVKRKLECVVRCGNTPSFEQNGKTLCFSCLKELVSVMSEEQFKAVKPL